MSETVVSLEEAARSLPELVERVSEHREAALLVQAGRALARIIPVSRPGQVEDLVAFLHQWRDKHPEPDEQFAEAIEASRKAIQAPHDPWQ